MTTVRDALTTHLERATALRDPDAERVLRSALSEVQHHSDAAAVLRRRIDDRGRLAGSLTATNPCAAAAMRGEAEILTIVLASAGY